MKKDRFLFYIFLFLINVVFIQENSAQSSTVYDQNFNSNIRIGKIGEAGNTNIEVGQLANQHYIDFTGYRNINPDQIGARISALLFNNYLSKEAWVQNAALAFYTNGSGYASGTTDLVERMRISPYGNVGIGTSNPQNKLDVKGTIRATEVKVEAGWSDFVFDKDYKLPTLQEVENHINEHKHLRDIPSEAEVKENGVSLGEMQAKLLQKIEELTLYTIELNKTVKEQGELIQELRSKLE